MVFLPALLWLASIACLAAYLCVELKQVPQAVARIFMNVLLREGSPYQLEAVRDSAGVYQVIPPEGETTSLFPSPLGWALILLSILLSAVASYLCFA